MIVIQRKPVQIEEEQPTVQQIIKNLIKAQGYTQAQFAQKIGLKQTGLAARLMKDMRISSFEQIVDALGYDIVLKKRE